MKRKQPTLTNKLASALLALGHIPHDHAKQMTDTQVISLFQWDHYPIPHAHDGPCVGWNLMPRFIPEHRVKTATIDVPMIAKTKRIKAKADAFKALMRAKVYVDVDKVIDAMANCYGKPKPKRKIPSRPFGKQKRKLNRRAK
jgi:hypothetical protein